MLEQNLYFALSLALLGGLLQVLAVLVLAYPEYQKTHKSKKYSINFEKILFPTNLLLQILVGFVNTTSTWYGPISIVIPARVAAQLFFITKLFGYLGIEDFPTNVTAGVKMVILGACVVLAVGPGQQNGQDIVGLFEMQLAAKAWVAILVFFAATSGHYCIKKLFHVLQEKDSIGNVRVSLLIVLVAKITSSVLLATISKCLVGTSGIAFMISVFSFLVCSIFAVSASFLQVTGVVDHCFFLPTSACAIQVINALTGLIVWQDWLVVQSWSGYCIGMTMVVFGLYLISFVDLHSQLVDNDYSLVQSMTITIAKTILQEYQNKDASSEEAIFYGDKDIKLVAFAGGTLNSMLPPWITFGHGETFHQIDSFTSAKESSMAASTTNQSLVGRGLKTNDGSINFADDDGISYSIISSSLRSSWGSYGTVDPDEKFSESFLG